MWKKYLWWPIKTVLLSSYQLANKPMETRLGGPPNPTKLSRCSDHLWSFFYSFKVPLQLQPNAAIRGFVAPFHYIDY